MSYVTSATLRDTYGTQELLDATAPRDPARVVTADVLDLVIDGADTSGEDAGEVEVATILVEQIDAACAQAISRIDSTLAARWPSMTLPVTPTDDVSRIALWIARYYVHADLVDGSVIVLRYKDAIAELRDFAAGRVSFGLTPPTVDAAVPIVTAPDEVFTSDLLATMP